MRQWYAHGWKREPAPGAPALLDQIIQIESLKAELLGMEARLRNHANDTPDTRLAAALDRAADQIERGIERLQEKLDTRNIGVSKQ